MYSSTYLHMRRDHRAFMSPESCSKVFSTDGKPRHIPLRQSRPYQPRACFLFVFHFELTPFSDGQLSNVSARPTVFNWKVLPQLFSVPIIKLSTKCHPFIPMFSSCIPSGTLLLVILFKYALSFCHFELMPFSLNMFLCLNVLSAM